MKLSKQLQLLRPGKAAASAGVSTVALWKAQQRGEIRAAALTSKGALYDRGEIQRWKKERKLKAKAKKTAPRGRGKSDGIISLPGISQSFSIWHRGVAPLMHQWDQEQIASAKLLLNPMMKLWSELHQRQGALGDTSPDGGRLRLNPQQKRLQREQ
jgi:hypothetical protein